MSETRVVRVAQIAALPHTFGRVLDHLLHRSAERGAVAVCGRVIPRFVQAFADRNCVIRRRQTHTLIHSPDPELLDSFATGRAFLSLFESEGPLQIWIKAPQALERCRATDARTDHGGPATDAVRIDHKQSPPNVRPACTLPG
jgi:hypothetical protein